MNTAADAPPVAMPPGIRNVYIYEMFNSASWIVVLGSPMLVYLQRLGASATALGVAAGLAPLFSTLQIPAARYVEKVGYRKFVVSGWTARAAFSVGIAAVALIPGLLSPTTRIALILLLIAGYTFLRGISLCGVMPWFTHIVPEARRGEFLAKDQLASASAVVVALSVFAWILAGHERWYSYGLLFALGACCAFIGVRFLRRVPDVAPEKIVRNLAPTPWRAMLFHPPFRRYMQYTLVVNAGVGASTVFWVRLFRTTLHVSDSHILVVAAITTAVLSLALYLVSQIIDRTGTRPALTLSGGLFLVHFGTWSSVAAGLIPVTRELILFQCVVSGFANALWNLANLRAVIGIIPQMGRAHFLALYSVAANLTVALTPLLWGPIFDHLGAWQVAWGRWHWNGFSIFYLSLVATCVWGLVLLRRIEESGQPMDWDDFTRELLVNTPARAVGRVFSRFRGPGM